MSLASALLDPKERNLQRGGGGGGVMGWARPIFLEKRGGLKENFTMIGGGSLCVPDHSALPEFLILERSYFFQ